MNVLSRRGVLTISMIMLIAVLGIFGATVTFAHHPVLDGSAVCNPQTGMFDITWFIGNDQGGAGRTMEITAINRTITNNATNTTVTVGTMIAPSGGITATESVVSAGTYTLTVTGKWAYAHPDIYETRSKTVNISGTCEGNGGNQDCPVGTTQYAKFEWNGSGWVLDGSNTGGVTISGNATAGSWTATLNISHLVVKGGSASVVNVINPPATSGGYSNSNLPPVGAGNIPNISNIKFCGSFDWNWEYPDPTCEGLTVTYPVNIPDGQANDVNIRVKNLLTQEEQTFNFHNNSGTWSGTMTFDVTDHPSWPGWTYFAIVWTQVGGTNYHWEGRVECGNAPDPQATINGSAVCKISGDWDEDSDADR